MISSNPARALRGEIVDRKKADAMIARLTEDDMYTGWAEQPYRDEALSASHRLSVPGH